MITQSARRQIEIALKKPGEVVLNPQIRHSMRPFEPL